MSNHEPTWRAGLALFLLLGGVPGLLVVLAAEHSTPGQIWVMVTICALACWFIHCEDWHQKHPRWQRDSEMRNWYGPRDVN